MAKFIVIGERIHCISPTIREAMETMTPEPILKRAREQLDAGAACLDVNIGPAEMDGPELMQWAVRILQENFDNVPLCLDTANRKAIEAGIQVYNRAKGKPIVNSADAGARMENIDLAAANDAICIALCSKAGVPADNEERMRHCREMLERGQRLGMAAEDLWFDPLFLAVRGMQERQMEVLRFIRELSDLGLNSTGGLSNVSNMLSGRTRSIFDGAVVAMAVYCGLTSCIADPCQARLMETIRACVAIRSGVPYADAPSLG